MLPQNWKSIEEMFFFKFIYFERDGERKRGAGRERGERESQAGSTFLVQSLMRGLMSQTCEIMT